MMMMSCHYFHNHLINISICWWWWWRSHTLNEKRHKTSDQLNGGCTVNENYSEGTNFKIGQIQNVAVVDEEDWVIGVKISLSRWFFSEKCSFSAADNVRKLIFAVCMISGQCTRKWQTDNVCGHFDVLNWPPFDVLNWSHFDVLNWSPL